MLKNITLEMSLKPFIELTDGYIDNVCENLFKQWHSLIKEADMISILLWCADGSEILDYKGKLNAEMEWAKYIGGANPLQDWDKECDPEGLGLHTRYYLYTQNPPVFTYERLKYVVSALKRIGGFVTKKKIRVGETFDPGPEFAKSDFKYRRHNEICIGESMGIGSMVCCYGVFNEDNVSYATYPNGIPQNEKFGRFFGKQTQKFLTDIDFDYIWFSNGFGFGTETWGTTGAIFDGEKFNTEKFPKIKENILEFWKLFREECPNFPIETRGTNLTTGIDLASDGVPLKDIYDGNFNILPPPNSPWASMDGDFGLELTGYMSRIAELPNEDFLFRYYIHDPWWLNSPWIDRYEQQPHDIYLPLAIARINENGHIVSPNYLSFLSVDNSYGELPDSVADEVIPHIKKAFSTLPDAVSPIVWVYPFLEYHKYTDVQSINEMFSEDWFIRGAINNGLPLSSVVSTTNFVKTVDMGIYDGSILVCTIPKKDSVVENKLIDFINSGGKIIFYGNLTNASEKLLSILKIKLTTPINGCLKINVDSIDNLSYPQQILHSDLMCAGGIDTIGENAFATVSNGTEKRDIAIVENNVVWLRAGVCCDYEKGGFLLQPHNPEKYFISEILMRFAIEKLGYKISFIKENTKDKSPVMMLKRHQNAFWFSGYNNDTTVKVKFQFPLGAPLLIGTETKLKDGCSNYSMQRAWNFECRAFVVQEEDAKIICHESAVLKYAMKRKLEIKNLKNATVRIFADTNIEVLLNSVYPYMITDKFDGKWIESKYGKYFDMVNITGDIIVFFQK